MHALEISQPLAPEHFADRDRLLQQALRPEALPFGINAEYPLVLKHGAGQFSYCVNVDNKMIAHANLWPRILHDAQSGQRTSVGLIGNVATDEHWRGRGVMSKLLEHFKLTAADSGIKALYLWSDLSQFYQNQGFRSRGRELRWSFSDNRRIRAFDAKQWAFSAPPISSIDDSTLEAILRLRGAARITLQRSTSEMRELLSIPATYLLIGRRLRDGIPEASIGCYAVIGRGYDLAGTIHEWGVSEPTALIAIAKFVLQRLQLPQLLLLTPSALAQELHSLLKEHADEQKEHPLALVCQLDHSEGVRQLVEHGFIWGLDSI